MMHPMEPFWRAHLAGHGERDLQQHLDGLVPGARVHVRAPMLVLDAQGDAETFIALHEAVATSPETPCTWEVHWDAGVLFGERDLHRYPDDARVTASRRDSSCS